ncbi:MAG: DNA repair exonuclease [Eubacterium sp.]|nr:DNA repair exonuclease [Eubacterium sp.]
MKLIHCADLHLDSKLSANLDREKARERKKELLFTYEKMVDYAAANSIEAILISGDLFDTHKITQTTKNTVLNSIKYNPDIHFYYLKGNHDDNDFLNDEDDIPENLFMFSDKWTTYYETDGKITISGIELTKENSSSAHISLVPDIDKYNIVMLHCQLAESTGKNKAEVINIKDYRNKGIDYLALGHIHARKTEKLDARGTYCYPGCLEGRGFDECGEHGFEVLDIDESNRELTTEFVSVAKRRLYAIEVDVTGAESTTEIYAKTEERLAQEPCTKDDLIKIILTGEYDTEAEKDPEYIVTKLSESYYFVKVYDETKLRFRPEDYINDKSLKGEFIRLVSADETLSEEQKNTVIRYGLQAINGEEVK